MIKLTVLYGHPSDPAAFDAYYRQTHVPLVKQIPGLQRFELARVQGTPDGSPAAYYQIAELCFEDMAAFGGGMGGPQGQAAANDVPNFASGGATLLITELQDLG